VCSSVLSGGSFSCEKENGCSCSRIGDEDCYGSCLAGLESGYSCQNNLDNISGWAWSENIGWISMTCKNHLSDSLASWNSTTGVVSGYAWSDNIGWISFNCADNKVCSNTNQFCVSDSDCPGEETCVDIRDGCALVSDYNVIIDTVSGEFSGYAWSDSVGWLSFNRGDTGTPPGAPYNGSEGYIAKKSLNEITGWGKFLSASGGWDGWIKFSCYGDECGTSNFETYFSGDYIGGYAWGSDIVGWISFGGSCAINYMAQINPEDGQIFGEAWSENIGWISFQRDVTGTPPAAPYNSSEAYIAKMDTTSCQMTGWARAIAACNDNYWGGSACTSSGAGDKSGGWDGWIKLNRGGGSPDYGIILNSSTGEFEGWGWGDGALDGEGVVGWISTNDTDYDGSPGPYDYQITSTFSCETGPTLSTSSESWSYCSDSKHPTLNWACSETQIGRQVQIKEKGGAASCSVVDFTEVVWDKTDSEASASISSKSLTDAAGQDFAWNTNYCWRAKCQSDSGWSSWVIDSDGFETPLNNYPTSDFTWGPLQTLKTDEWFYFYDDVNKSAEDYSKCYDSSGNIISCTSRNWTFEGADSYCECSNENCEDSVCLDDGDVRTNQGTNDDPIGIKIRTRPGDSITTVSLQTCDSNNYCCTQSQDISTIRSPKWREIIPWL